MLFTDMHQRSVRQLAEIERFRAWLTQEGIERTDETREETRALNQVLRSWFSSVSVKMTDEAMLIATPRASLSSEPRRTEAKIDRVEWTRFAPVERRAHTRYRDWDNAEIIGSLLAWADVHQRAPTWADWIRSGPYDPTSPTLIGHFGTWKNALRDAGLEPDGLPRPRNTPWDDLDVIRALADWTKTHGSPPEWADWMRATLQHPSTTTVREHYGTWQAALVGGVGEHRLLIGAAARYVVDDGTLDLAGIEMHGFGDTAISSGWWPYSTLNHPQV